MHCKMPMVFMHVTLITFVVSFSFVNSLLIGFLVIFAIAVVGHTLIYVLNRWAETKEKSKV